MLAHYYISHLHLPCALGVRGWRTHRHYDRIHYSFSVTRKTAALTSVGLCMLWVTRLRTPIQTTRPEELHNIAVLSRGYHDNWSSNSPIRRHNYILIAGELSSNGKQNENLRLLPFKLTTDSQVANDPDDLSWDVPRTPAALSVSHRPGGGWVDRLQPLSRWTRTESLHAFNRTSHDNERPWQWSCSNSAKCPRSSELLPNRLSLHMSDDQMYPCMCDGVTMLRGLYLCFNVHAPPATITHTYAHTLPVIPPGSG